MLKSLPTHGSISEIHVSKSSLYQRDTDRLYNKELLVISLGLDSVRLIKRASASETVTM